MFSLDRVQCEFIHDAVYIRFNNKNKMLFLGCSFANSRWNMSHLEPELKLQRTLHTYTHTNRLSRTKSSCVLSSFIFTDWTCTETHILLLLIFPAHTESNCLSLPLLWSLRGEKAHCMLRTLVSPSLCCCCGRVYVNKYQFCELIYLFTLTARF